MRILAATAVLHAHAWLVTRPATETAHYWHVFDFSLDFHAVHAFFVLSGMLLTWSLLRRPDPIRFAIARVLRYGPAILVSALIAAYVIGPLFTGLALDDYLESFAPLRFVIEIATLTNVNAVLPGVFDHNTYPGVLYVPLWTVHYEVVFSLCLAAIFALGLLGYRRLVIAGLVATLAINVGWFWNGEQYAYLGSPHHLVRFSSAFGIGIALAVFAERVPVTPRILVLLALICLPLAYSPVAALAGLVLMSYAILVIGFCNVPLAKPLAALGTWSYGFYVSGMLIEQTLVGAFPFFTGWAVFVIAFALSLVAGWASWRFVEKPALAWVDPINTALRRAFRREPHGSAAELGYERQRASVPSRRE